MFAGQNNDKPKKFEFYQQAWQHMKQVNQENDHVVAKYYVMAMHTIRSLSLFEFYSALEEIFKEAKKRKAEAEKNNKK